MNFKVFIYAPDDAETISSIISAATDAGAGRIGRYSHCAFVCKGWGQWKANEGATPFYGTVGEITHMDEVKIEMRCPAERAGEVKRAIKSVHPFEEANVEFFKLEEID